MAAAVPWVLGGLGVASTVMGASAEAQQYENQAVAMEAKAQSIKEQGAAQANAIREQRDPILGAVTANAAGSGVEVGTGSVLDVIRDNAFNIEMDALTALSNAEKEAQATRVGAQNMRAAKPSGISTLLGGFGAGLSGYASGMSFLQRLIMAKLPQYTRQVIATSATPGAAPVDTSMARATGQFAQGISAFATMQSNMMAREARDYTINAQNETTVALAQEKANLTNNAKTGSEYAEGIKTFIETSKQTAMEKAPNQKAADEAGAYYDRLMAIESESAIKVAARINAENTAAVTEQSLKMGFNDTFQNPENFEKNLETGLYIIGTSDIPESEMDKAFKAYTNELTVYRMQGLIKQNPALAKKELDQGQYNAILTTDQLMKLTNQADQQVKAVGAAQKQKLSGEIKDYVSYKMAGGQENRTYSEDSLKAVYGEEQGAAIYSQIKEAERFAVSFGSVELASAEELVGIVEAERVTGPEDFQTQAKQESLILRAVSERNKQLSQDPALYSMKSGNVQEAFESFQATGDGKSYAEATTAEQSRLGVPGEYLSVFSKSQAEAMVKNYNEGGEDAFDMINDLKNQFGDYFPVVMRDLNRAGLSPHASLVSVLEPSTGNYLSLADKAGYKTMSDNIGKDNLTDIKDNTKALLEDRFFDTLNGTPSGISMKNQVQKSTELLAMYYLDSGMIDDAGDAADKAYEDVINSRYTFQDTYRVPVKVGSYNPDSARIETSLDSLMDTVSDMDLMPPYDPSLPYDQRLEVYRMRLNPKWQTRGDDAGVELVDQNQQAVLTSDGQKIFYTWQELEDMTPERSFNFLGLGGL